jgi:hypothetical protein
LVSGHSSKMCLVSSSLNIGNTFLFSHPSYFLLISKSPASTRSYLFSHSYYNNQCILLSLILVSFPGKIQAKSSQTASKTDSVFQCHHISLSPPYILHYCCVHIDSTKQMPDQFFPIPLSLFLPNYQT